MKKSKLLPVSLITLLSAILFNITAFAEEFTEADKRILGIFPIWLFILILAAAVMLTIIIIIETAKRKHK